MMERLQAKTVRTEAGIAIVLYVAILAMNLSGLPKIACDMGNHLFVGVCLLFCALDWRKTRDDLLLAFMIFTFAADVMSGFSRTFAFGVVLFFASQIVMSFIIWKNNGGRRGWGLRIILIAAGIAGIAAAGLMNPLYAFGIVYFMWFFANMIQAVTARGWDNLPLRIAMPLYIIGDICLISKMFVPSGGMLYTILRYGTWMPYLPAVFLIAVSGKRTGALSTP